MAGREFLVADPDHIMNKHIEAVFRLPFNMFREAVRELRQRPYLVAVGEMGMSLRSPDVIELLARTCRYEHQGSLRANGTRAPVFRLGFVPFAIDRGDTLFPTVSEGSAERAPVCLMMLGTGGYIGRFAGVLRLRERTLPVRAIRLVGPGMHEVPASSVGTVRLQTVPASDAERWSRLIGALGGRDVWQRLTALSYCIVGAGRTGSLVATTLAKHGVRDLKLVDPDLLEEHNLDSMDAVRETDVGRFKVDAVAQNLGRDMPFAHIEASNESVMTRQARGLIKETDVVICCVDNDGARLATAALACCYQRPLLDIGTGVSFAVHSRTSLGVPERLAGDRRAAGADVRLILPGDGCILCWGGLANSADALRHPGPVRESRPWHRSRAGSLRSLNQIAAHLGMGLLEDLIAGRLAGSSWIRYEMSEHGVPVLSVMPRMESRGCFMCRLQGIGDLLTANDRFFEAIASEMAFSNAIDK